MELTEPGLQNAQWAQAHGGGRYLEAVEVITQPDDWVIFEEARLSTSLRMAGGSVLDCSSGVSTGVSYTSLAQSSESLSAVDLDGLDRLGVPSTRLALHEYSGVALELTRLGEAAHELIALASEIDAGARDHHASVENVVVEADLTMQSVRITAHDGTLVEDVRPVVYVTTRVIAGTGGRRATGFYTPGVAGTCRDMDGRHIGAEAAARACVALEAVEMPGGRLPVVIGPGRGAVLVHEACCHPLEGDEILRDSIYARRQGEVIASPCVTITDDPTIDSAVGSYRFDDEGVAASPTRVVQEGVLAAFLTDRTSASRLGSTPTGNGRRSGWRQPVLPRMSNTVVSPGTDAPADLIGSVRDGLYAQHVGGGQVSEQTGEFVFRVLNGFRIRNGRLAEPVRETTVSGTGQQVLRQIDGLGDDAALGAARCGKHGQLVTVGVCGPTMLINGLVVGAA